MKSFSPLNLVKKAALVIDYGGQYTHLITRRLRELGVYAEIIPYDYLQDLEDSSYELIVLSGSHKSVTSADTKMYDSANRILRDQHIPVLGICFGHQLIAHLIGGKVVSDCGEYGRTTIRLISEDELFAGWNNEETVWMSHSDCVVELPRRDDIRVLAVSENGSIAAFKVLINNRPVYGVQFHPEVSHTPKGVILLDNLLRIAGAKRIWRSELYYDMITSYLTERARPGFKALVAVSGGIDSTVSAVLARRAFGDNLIPVLVDHGLFREGELEEIVLNLEKAGISPRVVDARERFLSRLEGVEDCETRRILIGEEFARIFAEIIENEDVKYFIQGTTYPDVVESGATRVADKIKTHHNVGGLPGWFMRKVEILEPLRYLYKDEVRRLAKYLGIPDYFIKRHPFPGPGLAVRIMGKFTREKLDVCRKASRIVEDVLREYGYYEKVWQAFAVVGDDKWVGVKGDSRRHGYIVTIRVVESTDGMTADYVKLPYEILDEISRRVTNNVDNVVMVTYAVTSKPPSTIEPC